MGHETLDDATMKHELGRHTSKNADLLHVFQCYATLYISNEKGENTSAETLIVVFIGDDWGRIVENSPVGQGRGPGTGGGG